MQKLRHTPLLSCAILFLTCAALPCSAQIGTPRLVLRSGGVLGANDITMPDDGSELFLCKQRTDSTPALLQAYWVAAANLKALLGEWTVEPVDRSANAFPKVTAIAMSRKGRYVYWATDDGQFFVDDTSGRNRSLSPLHTRLASALMASPILVTTYEDSVAFVESGVVQLADPRSGGVGASYPPRAGTSPPEDISAIQFSADGKYIAIGSTKGYVRVIDRAKNSIAVLDSIPGAVQRIAFSPKKKWVAYLSDAGTLIQHALPGDTTKRVQYHVTGRVLGVSYDYFSGNVLMAMTSDSSFVRRITFSPTLRVDSMKIAITSATRNFPNADYIGVINSFGLVETINPPFSSSYMIGMFHSPIRSVLYEPNNYFGAVSMDDSIFELSVPYGTWGYGSYGPGKHCHAMRCNTRGSIGAVNDSLLRIYGFHYSSDDQQCNTPFIPRNAADIAFIGVTNDAIVLLDSTLWRFNGRIPPPDSIHRLPISFNGLTGEAPAVLSPDAKRALLETTTGPKIFNIDDLSHPIDVPADTQFGAPVHAAFSTDNKTLYLAYGGRDRARDSSWGELVRFDILRGTLLRLSGYVEAISVNSKAVLTARSNDYRTLLTLLTLDSLKPTYTVTTDAIQSAIGLGVDTNLFATGGIEGTVSFWRFGVDSVKSSVTLYEQAPAFLVTVRNVGPGRVHFELTADQAGPVSLQMYDVLGKAVAIPVQVQAHPGVNVDELQISGSGTYFYEAVQSGRRETGMISVMK